MTVRRMEIPSIDEKAKMKAGVTKTESNAALLTPLTGGIEVRRATGIHLNAVIAILETMIVLTDTIVTSLIRTEMGKIVTETVTLIVTATATVTVTITITVVAVMTATVVESVFEEIALAIEETALVTKEIVPVIDVVGTHRPRTACPTKVRSRSNPCLIHVIVG